MLSRACLRVSLLAILVACTSRDEPARPPPLPAAPSSKAASLGGQGIVVRSDSGAEIFKIVIRGDELDVQGPDFHVLGKSREEKRYYRQADDGEAFLEVKRGEDGFKLRTPDGKLLWKIKAAEDKIKVSDNEENQNPWLLKLKQGSHTKVLDPSGRELGEVKFYPETSKLKVKDAQGHERFVVESATAAQGDYGVLLMSGVPGSHRGVILAELIARRL